MTATRSAKRARPVVLIGLSIAAGLVVTAVGINVLRDELDRRGLRSASPEAAEAAAKRLYDRGKIETILKAADSVVRELDGGPSSESRLILDDKLQALLGVFDLSDRVTCEHLSARLLESDPLDHTAMTVLVSHSPTAPAIRSLARLPTLENGLPRGNVRAVFQFWATSDVRHFRELLDGLRGTTTDETSASFAQLELTILEVETRNNPSHIIDGFNIRANVDLPRD